MQKTAEQIEADNLAFWERWKPETPYQATAPLCAKNPPDYSENFWRQFGKFVAVPLPSQKSIIYGFVKEESRDLFLRRVDEGILADYHRTATVGVDQDEPDPFSIL